MNKYVKTVLRLFLVFGVLVFGVNYGCKLISDKRSSLRNLSANGINSEITEEYNSSGKDIDTIISEKYNYWLSEYGSNAPERILFIPVEEENKDIFYVSADKTCAVCAVHGRNGKIKGFVECIYKADDHVDIIIAANAVILLCFLIILGVVTYIHFAVLSPFRRLSEYPERLARLRDIQKLPECKKRFFGKYIWGMNMLSDVLAASSKRIHTLESQRQTLVSTIAHGVKTPVSNIRLYTDAVRTGLYSGKGMTVDIADKIDRNTLKIEELAEELMRSANSVTDGYDIEIKPFHMEELADIIRKEYKDRMKLKRIDLSVECSSNAIVESDKYALYRAVSQLLENAVKYGDGSGIKVRLSREDEGFCISVRNRGELLPEKELPYVFRSYWRGSNAADKEGSGIGLYVVHETAKALGGSAAARRIEETSEMEFVIYIEKA